MKWALGIKMEKKDLKEKFLILGILTGIFLPMRILFVSYVSEHWIGSLGLVSAFGIVLVFLIKRKKLGWFGKLFEKQMKKTMGGNSGKYIIGFALFFLIYFGATLYFIERGNTIYSDDKEIFYLAIIEVEGHNIQDIRAYDLKGPELISSQTQLFNTFSKLDYMFSIAYSVMNDMSEGWMSHLVVVMFVEQIEVIGLLIFFRNSYKPTSKIQQANLN